MKNLMCLGLLLIAVLSCSRGLTDKNIYQSNFNGEGIVGGSVVATDDPILKHIVHVQQIIREEQVNENTTRTFYSSCTGVLIDPTTVLTAAHCVNGDGKIVIGTGLMRDLFAEKIYADFSAVHTKYIPNLSNLTENFDIAVVGIPKAPTGVTPIKISTEILTKGIPLTVAGYGQHFHPGNEPVPETDALKKVTLPGDTLVGIGDSEFALLQTLESGIGQGDSGGPVMIEKDGQVELVGITSRAVRFSHGVQGGEMITDKFNTHSVFSKVSSFVPWIEEQKAEFKKRWQAEPIRPSTEI